MMFGILNFSINKKLKRNKFLSIKELKEIIFKRNTFYNKDLNMDFQKYINHNTFRSTENQKSVKKGT